MRLLAQGHGWALRRPRLCLLLLPQAKLLHEFLADETHGLQADEDRITLTAWGPHTGGQPVPAAPVKVRSVSSLQPLAAVPPCPPGPPMLSNEPQSTAAALQQASAVQNAGCALQQKRSCSSLA